MDLARDCRRRPRRCGCCCSGRVEDTLRDGGVRRWTWGSPRRAAMPTTSPASSPCASIASASGLETDFGFEAAAVHVLVAEPLSERAGAARHGRGERLAGGPGPADRPPAAAPRRRAPCASCIPHQSHIPERAVRTPPALPLPALRGERVAASAPRQRGEGRLETAPCIVAAPHPNPLPTEEWGEGIPPRPLLLLPHPEAAEVVALIPEGPPRQFRWRGVLHQVAGRRGPSASRRNGGAGTAEETRDYYVVEDAAGRRFWLYRAGLYGRSGRHPAMVRAWGVGMIATSHCCETTAFTSAMRCEVPGFMPGIHGAADRARRFCAIATNGTRDSWIPGRPGMTLLGATRVLEYSAGGSAVSFRVWS